MKIAFSSHRVYVRGVYPPPPPHLPGHVFLIFIYEEGGGGMIELKVYTPVLCIQRQEEISRCVE